MASLVAGSQSIQFDHEYQRAANDAYVICVQHYNFWLASGDNRRAFAALSLAREIFYLTEKPQ